jgi:hypothetical protein
MIIEDVWIERVLSRPLAKEKQTDGRFKIWGKVPEADNRILRVIVLEDGETVHNAFFYRDFKQGK